MKTQYIVCESYIPTILILVFSFSGFNLLMYFYGERRKTGEV